MKIIIRTFILLVILSLNVSSIFSQEHDSIVIKRPYRDTNFHKYYVKKIPKVKNGHSILLCREIDGNKYGFNVLTTKYSKRSKVTELNAKDTII